MKPEQLETSSWKYTLARVTLERQLSEKLDRNSWVISRVYHFTLITDREFAENPNGVGCLTYVKRVHFCNICSCMKHTHAYVDLYCIYKSYAYFNVPPRMFHALGHLCQGCSYSCCGSFGVHSNQA